MFRQIEIRFVIAYDPWQEGFLTRLSFELVVEFSHCVGWKGDAQLVPTDPPPVLPDSRLFVVRLERVQEFIDSQRGTDELTDELDSCQHLLDLRSHGRAGPPYREAARHTRVIAVVDAGKVDVHD